MAGRLDELFAKKLIVVTGKGGSGKSLLSLAFAHRLSTLGKRVWVVELGRKRDRAFSRLPELVGEKNLEHSPTLVTLPSTNERIHVSVLDPTLSLSEYVDLKLPTGGLAGILLNNRVTASFLEVVPGLPDLVSLGKIWHSLVNPNEKIGPDTVIIDAPASGHAIALLNAPKNFKRITKAGPIYKDAALMVDFFSDPKKTGIAITTIPEEMSLQETIETNKALSRDFSKPFLFVNKCFPKLPNLEMGDNLPWRTYRYAYERQKRETKAVELLGKQPKEILPFFFPEPKAPPLFLRISEALR